MFTRNYYTAQAVGNGIVESKAGGCWFNNLISVSGEKLPIRESRYTYYTSNLYYSSLTNFFRYFVKTGKDKWVVSTNASTDSKNCPIGLVFGNGTAPESINDYTMSGDIFTTYTESHQLTYGYDENGFSITAMYTLTNTGTEDFTISEIGMLGYFMEDYKSGSYTGYKYYNNLLFERTLLENPITIPANGGVGQVTYTVRLDYPVPPIEE